MAIREYGLHTNWMESFSHATLLRNSSENCGRKKHCVIKSKCLLLMFLFDAMESNVKNWKENKLINGSLLLSGLSSPEKRFRLLFSIQNSINCWENIDSARLSTFHMAYLDERRAVHIHVNGTQTINAEEVKKVSRKLDISTQVSCSRHDHTQSHLNDVHWAGKYDAIEHTCKSPAERVRVLLPSTAKRNGKRCDAAYTNMCWLDQSTMRAERAKNDINRRFSRGFVYLPAYLYLVSVLLLFLASSSSHPVHLNLANVNRAHWSLFAAKTFPSERFPDWEPGVGTEKLSAKI